MRSPPLYLWELSLPFHAAFVFLACLSLQAAAAAGVDPGKQGGNHNITGGEAVTSTSTALVPFIAPGVVASPPPSSPVSGALCLACLSGRRRFCFLMVGNLPATPHPFDCSGWSPWPSSSSNASSSAALLHKHGNHVAGADSICNEVPSCSFDDHQWNASFPAMKLGKDLWTGPQSTYRTGPWNGKRFIEEFQLTISSEPAAVKVTFGSSFSLVTAGKDGVLQRMVWGPRGPAMNGSSPAGCAAFGLMTAGATMTSFCLLTASRWLPLSAVDWGTPGTNRQNASLDYCCGKSSAVDLPVFAWDVEHHSAASKDKTRLKITIERCRLRYRCHANLTWAPQGFSYSWMVDFSHPPLNTSSASSPSRKRKRNTAQQWVYLKPLFPHWLSWAPFVAVIIVIISRVFPYLMENMMKKWRTGMPCSPKGSVNTGADSPQDSIVSVAPIDFSTLRTATGGFAKRNIIGEGGFAIIYKGKLSKNHALARDVHKRKIAVKKLKPSALKGSDDFIREVELMSMLDHGRLVRLVAYCVEGEERILVYEYMQNKSLDGYIFADEVNGGEPQEEFGAAFCAQEPEDPNREPDSSDDSNDGTRKLRASLNWAKRLEIIHGIAQGVSYLHEGSGQNVIHRDLKPSNVLLDHKWTAKIADFGTTKLLDDTGTQTIVFSPGYAAPEYIRGDITLKCDVYSFGVVLLEIISGRRNITSPSLLSHAWKLWDEHTITDLFDPVMTPPRSQSELWSRLRRCIQIGLLCVQESPGDRPSMPQVLAMLTCISHSEPRKPKAPAVFAVTTEQH